MKTIPTCLLLACLAAPALAADSAAKPDVVAFNASVRVEVDPTGKPVKVEAPADLPESIRGFIEKRVASWQYQPAKANGVPATAVTYVRVGACAIPVAQGYRMGLDFKGNGPSLATTGPWFIPPPHYPREMQRRGAEGEFQIVYKIQADGTTKVASIEPKEGTSNRYVNAFRSALSDWIEDMRYRPEQVAGLAVETDMSLTVSFLLSDGRGNWREEQRKSLVAQAISSKECIAAAAPPAGPLPIATNSPVTVIPTPAG